MSLDSLEQHIVAAAAGEFVRPVWYLPGPVDRPHRLCVFLDGEYFVRDERFLEAIRIATGDGSRNPAGCLFVSHRNAEARHRDLLCNERFSRFIADDVVRWARERDAELVDSKHLICGLSLSGLAAAYLAFQHPAVFSGALCQSGSFWWLVDNPIELPRTSGKFWLSVGMGETDENVSHPPSGLYQRVSQIEGVKQAAATFERLGANVRFAPYVGGHAIPPWRDEITTALEWLLSGNEVQSTSPST